MAAPSPSAATRRSAASADPADNTTTVGPFKKLNQIGKGSFAIVYRGVHVKKRALVAIKSVMLYKMNKKLKDNLLSEISIMRNMRHPHIVALIDCQETEQHMHLVMEFCELGDLSEFIKKRASLGSHPAVADMIKKYPLPQVGGLNEVVVRHFLKQLASAMEFLRSKQYIHRDIKPQNLLLLPSPLFYARNRPETMPLSADEDSLLPVAGIQSLPMLKVADFGFARVLPQTSLAETLCGSPLYMAPEILRYEKYDATADLWSVGTVLHEMLVGKPPFRANNHVELLRKIEKQDDRIKFPEGCYVSSDLKKLIRSLLKKSPTERMGYEAFFDNSVVRGDIPGLVGEDIPSGQSSTEVDTPVQSRRAVNIPVADEAEVQRYSESPRDKVPFGTTPPSRPSSRANPASQQQQATGTPPQRPPSSFGRRNSQAAVQAGDQQVTRPQSRRPTITSHATAPAKQAPQAQQHDYGHTPFAAAAAQMGRRNSRTNVSPGSSVLKDHIDRERYGRTAAEERAQRERELKAAQDVADERDYVVVEKRAVEVNAFADELANSPQLHGGYYRMHDGSGGAMTRRATTQGHPLSTTGATTGAQQNTAPSKAIQIAPGRQASGRPSEPLHQRKHSYERRYGPNPGSAQSVITKALNMASFRVLGVNFSPPGKGGISPPSGYGAYHAYPTQPSPTALVLGDGSSTREVSKDDDMRIVHLVEDLASRSDVVYGFAEVKYKQLVPSTPSNDGHGLGIGHAVGGTGDDAEDDYLTVDATVAIAEEALVLYVRALSILARAIENAGSWWATRNGSSPRSGSSAAGTLVPASTATRMNNVVQWSRNRFNECLEKSEYVGRRLVEAQRLLPLDHPGHPSNHPTHGASATAAVTDSATGSAVPSSGPPAALPPRPRSHSATSVTTSADNITLTSGVTAEKLMYERALEMSRAAAVNELVGEDLPGCERAYLTAIMMLEAILDGEGDGYSGVDAAAAGNRVRSGSGSGGAKKDGAGREEAGDMIDGLEMEDRATVVKLLESARGRLKSLRRKIETAKQVNKRASLPPSGGTNVAIATAAANIPRSSPSGTPSSTNTPPK
ncbi:hypothetical protein BDY21DRAFT_95788 [Lineolata rhizophorae]|uniref:non-specific serine/threonine protein kinase n=1 Tax=Lineolata rhizophorae TaxID=578093 RepID=A0A6A6NUB0_9PEZI|nr:hypothetical protein BDY21DRAFT_95788 [Lineolata rhizophorae]